MYKGTHRFPPMDRVVYGIPLAEAQTKEIGQCDSRAVYVTASGTLNRETDVVNNIRHVPGNRLAGVCAKIGVHIPRTDVVAAAQAVLILIVGGALILVRTRISVRFPARAAAYCPG